MSLSHLLIFTPGFPSSEEDTTCLPATQQFVLSFSKQYPGTKITVVTLHYPFTTVRYNWNGIDIIPVNGRNKAGLSRGITVLKAVKKARVVNASLQVDAVLSFWLTDAALAGKHFANKNNIPHLIWMHGQDARPGNKYVKWVNPQPRQLAAISQYQSNVFTHTYNKTVGSIINNGINPEIFPTLNTQKRTIDFLAAGNLIPLKQYHMYVEMLYKLKVNGHTGFKAVLAGEGILFDHFKALREKYNLETELEITDKIEHPALLQLMNNARVFVHPSSYEGHSTVMLEALYSGCKVVSFIPPADSAVPDTIICTDEHDMETRCNKLLQQNWTPQRILVNDIKNSVEKIYTILQSQLTG